MKGLQGHIGPHEMTLKPHDTQNDIQAPQKRLRASRYVSKPSPFCLHASQFGLQ